jgi:hypothetical protein
MVIGCREKLEGIESVWFHNGKLKSNYGVNFWRFHLSRAGTDNSAYCGMQNINYPWTPPEGNPDDCILHVRCARKLGYIW